MGCEMTTGLALLRIFGMVLLLLLMPLLTRLNAAELSVVNWSDYIAPTTVDTFSKETGIAVRYAILDSDEWLQSRLFANRAQYDVVYPSSTFMAKQIRVGVYEKLDWSKIPNAKNLDPVLMAQVAKQDPGNLHGVPYFWGTDGLLVNTTQVQSLLGKTAIPNSWDLLLNPSYAARISACGLSLPDSPSDVFPVVLAFMGRDPNSKTPQDYHDAYAHLLKIRPYIAQFNTAYTDDMGAGKLCVAFGWSGDVAVVRQALAAAKLSNKIDYLTPKNHTGIWFTMMGIPQYSRNKDSAYQWINYILRADIAADISNQTTYAMGVLNARPLMDAELLSDSSVYPSSAQIAEFFVFEPMDTKITSLIATLWSRLKSAR